MDGFIKLVEYMLNKLDAIALGLLLGYLIFG